MCCLLFCFYVTIKLKITFLSVNIQELFKNTTSPEIRVQCSLCLNVPDFTHTTSQQLETGVDLLFDRNQQR